MSLSNQDRVQESSTTTGTGTYTLAGAVTGYQSFSAIGDGNTVNYAAWEVNGSGNPSGGWETGLGTYTASGTTLARTTIYSSSNSGSAVSWSAGTRYIACAPLSGGDLTLRGTGTTGTNDCVMHWVAGAFAASSLSFVVPYATNFNFNGAGGALVTADQYRFASSCGDAGYSSVGMDAAGVKVKRPCAFGFVDGATYGVADVAFYSPAPLVITLTSDGSTGTAGGWIQNTGGEASLASAFTKSNATFGSTNLSFNVIAGRSYRIQGYLITSNSTAGEGAQFDFNGGTATATTFAVALNAIGTNSAGTVRATALATALNYTSVTGTNDIFVNGYLKVNAGGTFILRAAENTTSTGTMTLGAGSWLALHDTVNL